MASLESQTKDSVSTEQTPIEVELKIDTAITTQDNSYIDYNDVRSLHDWNMYEGEIDEPLTVCVMDSGIHQHSVDNHSWFENVTIEKRYDVTGQGVGEDAIGHGTGCASIIAKNTPKVEFYDLRIFGKQGKSTNQAIREAYDWLIEHADEIDIVNMSWGAPSNITELNVMHEQILSHGVHDVVAAGNSGADGGSPATSDNAFSAGAVDIDGKLTRFSSSDPNRDNPDVAAVGKDVLMARAPDTSMGRVIDDQFVKASGTSFSAPHTTAAYVNAMYREQKEWNKALEIGSKDIEGIKADGDGVLKLDNALDVEEEPVNVSASVWGFAGKDILYIDANWMDGKTTNVEKLEETNEYLDVRIEK